MNNIDFDPKNVQKMIKTIAELHNISLKSVSKLIRISLTDELVGLDLLGIMKFMGKDMVLKRLDLFLTIIQKTDQATL